MAQAGYSGIFFLDGKQTVQCTSTPGIPTPIQQRRFRGPCVACYGPVPPGSWMRRWQKTVQEEFDSRADALSLDQVEQVLRTRSYYAS